jgi:hypothetical protein
MVFPARLSEVAARRMVRYVSVCIKSPGSLVSELHLSYLMINIAHPFDRYLRALTAVMPNAADSGAFSGLPGVMGRAIKDIGSWTFWLPHWRKRRAQAHLFSRQTARRDLRKTRRGNASGLTPRQRRRKPPPGVGICAITSSNAAINKIKRHCHEERNFGHSDPPDRASEPRTDRTYRVHNSQV